jgi:radical SAM superfamily enzyme YgiQ (UPF0313 family)
MRVVLLYFRENYTPAPPMGLLYIGTVLKKAGHQVKVIDSFPSFHQDNLKTVNDFNPDIIGLSVLTTGYRLASHYTGLLKEQNPNAKICWGGVHPSALPKEVLLTHDLDFVVIGEGESTMLEVCENLNSSKGLGDINGLIYISDGNVVKNEPRQMIDDLDTLPIPDRSLLESPPFSWYLSPPGIIRGSFLKGVTTFYTSRGCPYECIFCCSHLTCGRKFRQRSIPKVMEEIHYLVKDHGVKGLYFNDDTFGIDKEWTLKFCSALKQSGLDMVWGCQTRANVASKELFTAMKDAGCIQVDIGAESGSDKILSTLKKGITKHDIKNAFKVANMAGLKTFATFILGNPGETIDDINETERLSKEIDASVSFLILVPYPGSSLFEMAKSNNWFKDPNFAFSEDWANKQSENPIMEITFKSDELLEIRARLQNQFLLKNNIRIMFSFLLHPIYCLYIFATLLRHPVNTFNTIVSSIRRKKLSIILETFYQNFNEELLRSACKNT